MSPWERFLDEPKTPLTGKSKASLDMLGSGLAFLHLGDNGLSPKCHDSFEELLKSLGRVVYGDDICIMFL